MNFKLYDLLSSVVPGFLIYITLCFYFQINLNIIPQIPAIVLAFIIGFIINAISSWSENILFWTWGGKPSDRMLDGKYIKKVKFYQYDTVRQKLIEECEHEEPTNDELFSIAMRHAISSTKITDFNGLYVFSRSILISLILSSILLNIHYWFNWKLILVSLLTIVIIWIRAKQNAHYYVREVLKSYLSNKQ